MGLGELFADSVSSARDAAVRLALSHWIKGHTQAIRNMTKLHIDSKQHTITLELELAGESAALSVEVGHYQVTEVDGRTMIEVSDVRTSKEWMTLLAAEFLPGRKFEVPRVARMVL